MAQVSAVAFSLQQPGRAQQPPGHLVIADPTAPPHGAPASRQRRAMVAARAGNHNGLDRR
jgi:hypothetical protein